MKDIQDGRLIPQIPVNILSQVKSFISSKHPNLILLHIGTNDLDVGDTVQNVVNEVSKILDTIYTFNSNINVILAKIINRVGPESLQDSTTAFNNALEIMANTRINNGDKLSISGYGDWCRYYL